MTIEMSKFGTVLNSRPAGREALLAIRPHIPCQADIMTGGNTEDIMEVTLDFSGVEVLTPSFADEFITPLVEKYAGCTRPIRMIHTQENITVRKTLEFLSQHWLGKVELG